MKTFFSDLWERTLLAGAAVLHILAFIPILFPYILPGALGTGFFSLLHFRKYRSLALSSGQDHPIASIPRRRSKKDSPYGEGEERPAPTKEQMRARRGWKAYGLAVRALLINATLYAVLLLHSYSCYINPLSKDLQPIRDSFQERKIKEEGEQSQKSGQAKPEEGKRDNLQARTPE